MSQQPGFRKQRSGMANFFGFVLFVAILAGGYYWFVADRDSGPTAGPRVPASETGTTSENGDSHMEAKDESMPVEEKSESDSANTVIDKVLLPPDVVEREIVKEEIQEEREQLPPAITGNITVSEPTNGSALTSPFTIKGEARVFENTVLVRVTNTSGFALIEEFTTAHSPDVGQWGPFQITLHYQFSSTKEGFVEVYSESARDGSDENMVRIPVTFN